MSTSNGTTRTGDGLAHHHTDNGRLPPSPLTRTQDGVNEERPSTLTGRRQEDDVSEERPSPLTGRRQEDDVSEERPSPLIGRRQEDDVSEERPSPLTGRPQEKDIGEGRPSPLTRRHLEADAREGDVTAQQLARARKEAALREHDLPVELPSLGDIRRALPPHVFQSRVSTSLYYVAKDAAQVAALYLLADWLWTRPWLPAWLALPLVPAYWLLQGTLFWALFVLGHDAGHASFSRYAWLNDTVGNVLHGFLLCPYYCWKLTHRQHHAFTGNMDRDEVFYPIRQSRDNGAVFLPCFGLGASWFAYLFSGYHPRAVNHFNPAGPALSRHLGACSLSIGLVAAAGVGLWHYGATVGPGKLLLHYAGPEFVFASYLVLTTFLHHTDERVPWYDDSLWNFVRGQLSSVDRHYGWCHHIVHNIGTHQVHHLFSSIPHYHLEEATRAFRRHFPHLVRKQDERILSSFWRMFYKWVKQRVVPDSTLVHVYT